MMGFGWLVPVLILVALAYFLGWLPQDQEERTWQGKQKHDSSTALDILEKRYASGEISRAEYLEMREGLRR